MLSVPLALHAELIWPVRVIELVPMVALALPEQVKMLAETLTLLITAVVVVGNDTDQGRLLAWTDEHRPPPENVAWVTETLPEPSVTSTKVDVQGTLMPAIDKLVAPVAVKVVFTGDAVAANTGAATIVPAAITHAMANALNCAFISIPRNKR